MESGDTAAPTKVKSGVPPVPLRTYKWEDIRREKRRGKYPWTYLYKGPYIEELAMEEDKEVEKPTVKKKKVVKKIVKKVKKKEAPKTPDATAEPVASKEQDATNEPETPKDETPKEESVVNEPAKVESPIEEIPKDETPREESLVNEPAKVESPIEEIPKDETPREESVVNEPVNVESPIEEIPKEKTPKDELPIEESPKEAEISKETEKVEVSESPVPRIELIDTPETASKASEEETPIKMDVEEICEETRTSTPTGEPPKETITIINETRSLSKERDTDEGKEIETITGSSEKITITAETPVDKSEPPETDSKIEIISFDTQVSEDVSKEDKNTESEDTCTENNVEQYLDKDDISKLSTANASMNEECISSEKSADENLLQPSTSVQGTSDVTQDKKRKHSSTSEITKSTLSLFQKMKNAKFKSPTFKIPKFKKLTFKKAKMERKPSKNNDEPPTVTTQKVTLRPKSDSPVYIHIPLNPSPEQIEEERILEEQRLRRELTPKLPSKEPSPMVKQREKPQKSPTKSTKKLVDIKYVTSKWKGFPIKGKRSPPTKKKDTKSPNGKKDSPKSSPKSTDVKQTTKKSDGSPVYIYIPLKPEGEETKDELDGKSNVENEELEIHYETEINGSTHTTVSYVPKVKETAIDFIDSEPMEVTEPNDSVILLDREVEITESEPVKMYKETVLNSEFFGPEVTRVHLETPIDYTEDDPRVTMPITPSKETDIDFPVEPEITEPVTPTKSIETPIDYTEDDPRVSNPIKSKETTIDFPVEDSKVSEPVTPTKSIETPIDYSEDDPRVTDPIKSKETDIDFPSEDTNVSEPITPTKSIETPIDYTEDDPRIFAKCKSRETAIDFPVDDADKSEPITAKSETGVDENIESKATALDSTDDPDAWVQEAINISKSEMEQKESTEQIPEKKPEDKIEPTTKETKKKEPVKKEPNKKVEKLKETTAKLGEDIKQFASKIKVDASKTKKFSPFKKKVVKKSSPVLGKATTEKKATLKREDSPKYIYIPLKAEDDLESRDKEKEKSDESEVTSTDPEMPGLQSEETLDTTERTEQLAKEVTEEPKLEIEDTKVKEQTEETVPKPIVDYNIKTDTVTTEEDIKTDTITTEEDIKTDIPATEEEIKTDISTIESAMKTDIPSTEDEIKIDTTVSEAEPKSVSPIESIEDKPKDVPKLEAITEKTGAKPKQEVHKKSVIEIGKETTEKISKDLKKLASKLKELKKKNIKPPTKKIGKPGSKKISPKSSKKGGTLEQKRSPTQSQKKRSDSPVEYIHIPLKGPLPPELEEIEVTNVPDETIEQSPVLEPVEKTETELPAPQEDLPASKEELPAPKEELPAPKEELPAPKEEISAPTGKQDTAKIDMGKFMLFKDKSAKPKKELPNISSVKKTKVKTKTETVSSSPFNSLKKTKDLSKKTFKAVKDAVTPKEKKVVVKTEEKVIKKSTVETKKTEKPDYIFIPLKTEDEVASSKEIKDDISVQDASQISLDENISTKDQEVISRELDLRISSEDPNVDDIKDNTSFDVSEIREESQLDDLKSELSVPEPILEEHHVSKEDEEDGLKIIPAAVSAAIKETVPVKQEEAIKSSLKAEDSPKMNKKVSFKERSMSEEENTVTEVKKKGDTGYEVVEVRKDDTKPKISILETAQSMSVDEEKSYLDKKIIKNASLDEDYNKWSQSIDHEYEPINPPEQKVTAATAVTAVTPSVHAAGQEPAPDAVENRLLRIPLDAELVVQADEDAGLSQDESLSTHEHRYISTPETGSRTEDINTSQIDSSALEQVPLKRGNRKQILEQADQPQTSNFQQSFKTHTDRLKSKIKNMKKPSLTISYKPKFEAPKFQRPKFQKPNFQRPKFQKPNFERPKFKTPSFKTPKFETPKFTMPKMPERPKINFPSFSLPRTGKRTTDDRQFSATESSVGSKKNIFDFRTYPRIFDKTKKKKQEATATTEEEVPSEKQFATVPPKAQRKKGPVGARWVHRFTDIKFADEDARKSGQFGSEEDDMRNRSDSLERRMDEDQRYKESLEVDEEMRNYERENREIHTAVLPSRWSHGSFHQYREEAQNEEEENEEEIPQLPVNGQTNGDFDNQQNNFSERSSMGSSGSRHRQGVLEEIDSDQFFLRQKGISQDNIQVGMYLSSEIRDAFKTPVNTLDQMENVQPGYGSREYDLDASDLSLSKPRRPKRKHLKKTKRMKKTPHASKEEVSFDQESINTEPEEYPRNYKTFPPSRPKRGKKPKLAPEEEPEINEANLAKSEDMMDEVDLNEEDTVEQNGNDHRYNDEAALMYENEVMKNIEQPEIIIHSDQKETTIAHFGVDQKDIDRYLEDTGMTDAPKPPRRRNKSLRSLNISEHDSIMGEFNKDKYIDDMLEQEIKVYRTEHEYIVPSLEEPPMAPMRRSRSRSHTESQLDDDRTSRGAESIVSECRESPCVADSQDAIVGYATIDKNRNRDAKPTAPKRKRSTKSNRSNRSNKSETKFFTVPRNLNDVPTPTRPTRNYSTLGPSRPPRRKVPDLQSEEKENLEADVTQYIEIDDDDHTKDLQSGEVINKMKGRPLPAPPRPPRKTRDSSREPLQDITHEDNIVRDDEKEVDTSPASAPEEVVEIEVSTQTDPLPDDFCCEEMVEEPTDRIVAPTRRRRSRQESFSRKDSSKERPQTPLQRSISPNAMVIERKVQTPTEFEDETVTHASLVVRPMAEYPPDSYVSQRFAADIPSILQDPIIRQPILSHDLDSLEYHREESPQEEASKSTEDIKIDETDKSDEITPYVDEFVPRLDETCESCEPDDYCTTETTEVIPEIPEKPARTKTQPPPPSSEECEPEISQPEEIPEIPQKPQRAKLLASSPEQVTEPPRPEVQPQVIERIIERQVPYCVTAGPDTEVEVLKAQRLQVTDLDVERLNVTELQAHKILVSEIDGVSIQISELSSKTGSIVVNGLEIPSGLIQEILDRLQPLTQPQPQPPPPPPIVREQVSTQTDELKRSIVETQTSIELKDTEEPQTSIEIKETDEPQTSIVIKETEEPPVQVETVAKTEEQPVPHPEPPQPKITEPPKEVEPTKVEESVEKPSTETKTETSGVSESVEKPDGTTARAVSSETKTERDHDEKEEGKERVDIVENVESPSVVLCESVPRQPHLESITTDQMLHGIPYVYNPSVPAGFYMLRPRQHTQNTQQLSDDEDIPVQQRRKRHRRQTRSTSEEQEEEERRLAKRQATQVQATRATEQSIPDLTGQLARAFAISVHRVIKHLISFATKELSSPEARRNAQIALIIFIVIIAGLILLGFGGGNTVHHHHWEYFNPPTDT